MATKDLKTEIEIPLRIVFVGPPVGTWFALQRGKGELVGRVQARGDSIAFDLTARARLPEMEGVADFLGPFVQGRPGERFVYVNSGTSAGDHASHWTRRAKVPLREVPAALVRELTATPGARLEAQVCGTARDGGPACATVPLLGSGWTLVRSKRS